METLSRVFGASTDESVDVEQVAELVGRELLHYAKVMTGSEVEAEDAFQDLIVVMLEKGRALREIEEPRAWLYTVIRRRSTFYREKRACNTAETMARTVISDPASRLVFEEAMQRLEPVTREIAILHLWKGLTFREISMVVGIPRGTALSLYHRGRTLLKEHLTADHQGRTADPPGPSHRRSIGWVGDRRHTCGKDG